MKASELLNTQQNVENTEYKKSSNEEIQTNEKIEHTPFYVRGNEKTGYFITLGDTRITETYETPLRAIGEVEPKNWNFMTTVISVITEKVTNELFKNLDNK